MIVYTVRGGVSAVIWTDVVQMFVYVAGALLVFFGLLRLIPGGWEEVVRTAGGAGHFQVFDSRTDPKRVYTFWAGLFGGIALTLRDARHRSVPRPAPALRALAARRLQPAWSSAACIVFAQFVLFLVVGAMLFTFYQHTPLPRPLGRTDEVLPLFVVTSLPAGDLRLHRRRDRRGGAVAIDQLAGRDDGERFLRQVRPARRRPGRR